MKNKKVLIYNNQHLHEKYKKYLQDHLLQPTWWQFNTIPNTLYYWYYQCHMYGLLYTCKGSKVLSLNSVTDNQSNIQTFIPQSFVFTDVTIHFTLIFWYTYNSPDNQSNKVLGWSRLHQLLTDKYQDYSKDHRTTNVEVKNVNTFLQKRINNTYLWSATVTHFITFTYSITALWVFKYLILLIFLALIIITVTIFRQFSVIFLTLCCLQLKLTWLQLQLT